MHVTTPHNKLTEELDKIRADFGVEKSKGEWASQLQKALNHITTLTAENKAKDAEIEGLKKENNAYFIAGLNREKVLDGLKQERDQLKAQVAEMATGTEARVCNDIRLRQKVGIAKYGITVAENPLPLKEWLNHAYQESLDKSVYLRRAIDEVDEVGDYQSPQQILSVIEPVIEVIRENLRTCTVGYRGANEDYVPCGQCAACKLREQLSSLTQYAAGLKDKGQP